MGSVDRDMRLLFEKKVLDVLELLNSQRRVPWAVIGGAAVSLWGARALPTVDLDIVGNKQTAAFLKKHLGNPTGSSSDAMTWKRGGGEDVDMLLDKEAYLKYVLDHAKKTPNMRVSDIIGTALMKVAAINNLFRIHGQKASKGVQDAVDLLNLVKRMSKHQRQEFIKAAEKHINAPYAAQDAKDAVKHVETGEGVVIGIYSIPPTDPE